jgi:hypothetical protein
VPLTASSKPTLPARCTVHSPAGAGAQTPEADGCVAVTLLAAGGTPTTTEPALAGFDGIAALLDPRPAGDGDARVHDQALRSSEKPASRRGHWAIGRPLMR